LWPRSGTPHFIEDAEVGEPERHLCRAQIGREPKSAQTPTEAYAIDLQQERLAA
jgi:hypothetical protein